MVPLVAPACGDHPEVPTLSRLRSAGRVDGPRVHDARIAALCLDHGVCALWTLDRDFSRFPDVATENPLIARCSGQSSSTANVKSSPAPSSPASLASTIDGREGHGKVPSPTHRAHGHLATKTVRVGGMSRRSDTIRRILRHLGLRADPPDVAPARTPHPTLALGA